MNQTTALVDIYESDLVNFISLNKMNLSSFTEHGQSELFKKYPFTLYRERKDNYSMVTIQIPLIDYVLFLSHGLIEH